MKFAVVSIIFAGALALGACAHAPDQSADLNGDQNGAETATAASEAATRTSDQRRRARYDAGVIGRERKPTAFEPPAGAPVQ